MRHKAWSGPLPPPESLEKFDGVIPNGAERIMVMTEREQEERHRANRVKLEHEARELAANITVAKRGQIIDACATAGGILVLLLCVGGAIYLGSLGMQWSATAVVSVPIMVTIGYLFRRHKK